MSAFGSQGFTQQPAQQAIGNRKPRGGFYTSGFAAPKAMPALSRGTPYANPSTRSAPRPPPAVPDAVQKWASTPGGQQANSPNSAAPRPQVQQPAVTNTAEEVRRATGQALNQEERDRWRRDEWSKLTNKGTSFDGQAPGVVKGDVISNGRFHSASGGGKTLAVPINRWGEYLDPFTGQRISAEQAKALAATRGTAGPVSDEQAIAATDFARAWDKQLAMANQVTSHLGYNHLYTDPTRVGAANDAFVRGVTVDANGMPVFTGGAAAQSYLPQANAMANAYLDVMGKPRWQQMGNTAGAALAGLFALDPTAQSRLSRRV
jgi:hypothetical protein